MLDKYTHSNLVYYKHNGDEEPYDGKNFCLVMVAKDSVLAIKQYALIAVNKQAI